MVHLRMTSRQPTPEYQRNQGLAKKSLIALAVVLGLVLVGLLVVRPMAISAIRGLLDREMSSVFERLGANVAVGDFDLSIGREISLSNLRVTLPGTDNVMVVIDRVVLDFSILDFIRGQRLSRHALLVGPRTTVDIGDVSWMASLLRRFRDRSDTALKLPGSGHKGHAILSMGVLGGQLTVVKGDRLVAVVGDVSAEVFRDENNAWVLKGSTEVSGLSDGEAQVSAEGSFNAGRGLNLTVTSSDPLFLAGALGADIAEGVSILGFDIALGMPEQRVSVGLSGVSVDNTTRYLSFLPVQVPATGGPFSADKIRVDLSWGELKDLIGGQISTQAIIGAVNRISFDNVDVTGTYTRSTPLAIEGLNWDIDLERDNQAFRCSASGLATVRPTGESTATSNVPTEIEIRALLTRDLKFQSMDLRTSGHLLVQALASLESRILDWPSASLDMSATVVRNESVFTATGSVQGSHLGLFWTKLCLAPIHDVDIGADFVITFDSLARTLSARIDPIELGSARFAVDLDVTRMSEKPALTASFHLPKQSCNAVAKAIPPVMIPRLDGLELEGGMSLEIATTLDFEKFGVKPVTGATLSIDINVDDCRVVSLGKFVSVEGLADKNFIHTVHEDDLKAPIKVGPGTNTFVPLSMIPTWVQQAALATEDIGFFEHQGFVPGLIKRALVLNLDRGWYVYGGSTISQQLVKNLFLSREKTLSRKLEEAVIVWEMEKKIEKERILELYLNCIEFGKNMYGIKEASHIYFNKAPIDLTPLEGAFIMATKPAPKYAYRVYTGEHEFTAWWVGRMEGILRRLWEQMEVLPEAEYRRASPYVPLFWYEEQGHYAYPRVKTEFLVPPGMPGELPRDM